MPGASFQDYVLEQLARFRGVAARRMFGGAGLFKAGVMFGLIAHDELFFKVGAANQADYATRHSQPFVFHARGRDIASASYWRVPDEIIEDPDELAAWAVKAHAFALQKRKTTAAKPRGAARAKSRRRSTSS